MYVNTPIGVQAHGAAASQPIFSRAVHPAQRKAPLIERRKRKTPAALNLDQIRRRKQKQARVLTADPPTHVRIAKAPAGLHYTLHRCVDVETQEVFFYPEYTGPAGEEEQHRVQWPDVVEISSPVARSGAETMRNAGPRSAGAATPSSEKGCDGSDSSPPCSAEEQGKSGETLLTAAPSLIQRRKRKAPAPLRLDVIPPFKRRNAGQVCVLEAPATHVRLHSVQAGPHHVMHQCLDAHTEELFFMPEYVGPKDEKEIHKVTWPQVINPAAKSLEHEKDKAFDEAICTSAGATDAKDARAPAGDSAQAEAATGAVGGGEGEPLRPGAAELTGTAGSRVTLPETDAGTSSVVGACGQGDPAPNAGTASSSSSVTACGSVMPSPPLSASSASSLSSSSTTIMGDGREAVTEKTCGRPCAASEAGGGGGAESAGALALTTGNASGASPGTPCDVAAVTATLLAAKAITVT